MLFSKSFNFTITFGNSNELLGSLLFKFIHHGFRFTLDLKIMIKMNTRKLITSLLLIMVTGITLAQNASYSEMYLFEFVGEVTTQGERPNNVLIRAMDGDTCFSSYSTRSNGKFAFAGEAEKHFILQFEKPGFKTKQLILILDNIEHLKGQIKTFKFEVNLTKTKKGESDEQELSLVDVIEISNSGNQFIYKSNRNRSEYLFKSEQLANHL